MSRIDTVLTQDRPLAHNLCPPKTKLSFKLDNSC